jgi:transcriptional regulator with XRE-family HTH domain
MEADINAELKSNLKAELQQLGKRLRLLRTERGWTLEDLAKKAGVSSTYLCRLECGDRQPSLSVLLNLAQAYNLVLPALFQSIGGTASRLHLDDNPPEIIRAGDRPLQIGNGLRYASLASETQSALLHPIHMVVPAHRQNNQSYQHEGEEWLYVLSGELILTLIDTPYRLYPGDAAHFDARSPHQLAAYGDEDVELILVACMTPRSVLDTYVSIPLYSRY